MRKQRYNHGMNNLNQDLTKLFNEESTGLEVFVRHIIKEKLAEGVSKDEILKELKVLEVDEENRQKCLAVMEEELGAKGDVRVSDYFGFDVAKWREKADDVGGFEGFFV